VLERHAIAPHAHDAEQDRKLETPGTCRSRIEHGDAAVVIRERHVRMTADDERRVFLLREREHVGT
jgi:hypothetical protein